MIGSVLHKKHKPPLPNFRVRFAAAENWFKPPMFFIDRTKAVIQHFFGEVL